MKTFEEKFTAWIDGELKGDELVAFEAEVLKTDDAELQKAAAFQLGDLLRTHGQARELQNAEFFNLQIMQQIEAEIPKPKAAEPQRAKFSWSLSRLALAGAFSLLVAGGLFHYVIPVGEKSPQGGNVADEIIKTQSGDPDVTASAFYSQKNDVTVLWLDGPKYTPVKKNATESHK